VTEQQWGASTDIHRMLSAWLLSGPLRPARNRMRLFARGVVALAAAAPWQVLRLAEEAGRGEISDRQLAEAQEALRQDPDIILTLPAALLLGSDSAAQAGNVIHWAMGLGPQSLRDALPDLLRCIFPNPFPNPFGAPARPKLPHCPTCGGEGQVRIPQSRRGRQPCEACLGTGSQPSCAALATAAYGFEDWPLLPLLADALQDAGCAEQSLLEHLRGPGPHARGCWALDLVLGKE
jgi:hypothetical protein